jgi:hypothetical protein
MNAVRKKDHSTLNGWAAMGALATVAVTKALTAFVISVPLSWLASYVFGGGVALRDLFGPDGLSYRRCLGLFAIWFAARVRIKFSGPGQIEIEGKR